jgi:DNA repair ATPase RecN
MKIVDIEAHHQNLDTQAASMQNSITNLEVQIKDTKQKVARSTTDRKVLMNELKQLQLKRAALESDFKPDSTNAPPPQ